MSDTCAVEGCDREVRQRGVCSTCYQRLRYQGRLDEICPKPVERSCGNCGKTFQPKTLRSSVDCCSKTCNDAVRHRALYVSRRVDNVKECLECGASLVAKRSDARFCDERCGNAWHYKQRALPAKRIAALPPCEVCGKPIGPKRRLFCSNACLFASKNANRYGITLRHFHDLMETQGNACGICGRTDWGKKGQVIDHDHETGEVRGVLCNGCNTGLGLLGENVANLTAAIAWISKDHAPMSTNLDS